MSRWAPAAEGCWVNGARFPAAPLPVPSCEWLRVAAGAGLNVMSLQTPLLTPGACRPSPNRERQAPGGRDPYGRRNQARRLLLPQAIPSVPKRPQALGQAPSQRLGEDREQPAPMASPCRPPRSGTKAHSRLLIMHDLFFFPVFFGTCACPDVLIWQEGSLRSRGQSTVWRSPGSRDFWGLGAVAPARARGHLLTLSALEPSGFLVPKHARDLMVLALGEPNKLFWCVGGIPIFNSQVVEKL